MNIAFNTTFASKYHADKRCYFGGVYEQPNCRINVAHYYLVESPDYFAKRSSEVLFGERFAIIKTKDVWSYVQMLNDGYCGWLPTAIILRVFSEQSKLNTVINRLANVYAKADMQSAIKQRLSYGAKVFVDSQFGNSGFVYSADLNGWIFRDELDCDCTQSQHDSSELMEIEVNNAIAIFEECSYVLGGRAVHGIDCSGLTQSLYRASSISLPRDSDMQLDFCASNNWHSVGRDALQFGDLIFWKGHVAMALNKDTLIHATSNAMKVLKEPVDKVIQRIQKSHREVLAVYRLPM